MPPIITVENLGKKYTLRHQGGNGPGYRRFSRDLLEALKRPFRRSEIRDRRSEIRSQKSEVSAPISDLGPPTSDLRPPTSDLRPPTSDLRPPTSDLCPPTSDLCPPTSDLRPPTSDLRPPTSDLRPPTSDLCPPTSDLRPPTSDLCPPTSDLRPPTSDLRPPTSDLRPPTSESFWALRDVSFQVQQGEVLGIIGRNGAGKSTLLKILSRITEPSEGRVRLRGRVASLLEVGTGFHPELTGRENVYLNGAVLGMSRSEIRRKFDEIVAFAEVEKFLDTPVKHYSSGMYVRLAFAVAAQLEPEILIVDEVLAVGDVQFQKKCLGKMSEVATAGRTVLFVSHNMQAVKQLTQRVIVLVTGHVAGDADTDQGIAQYRALGKGVANVPGIFREQATGRGPRVVAVEVIASEGNGLHLCGHDLVIHFEIHVPESRDDLTFSYQLIDEGGTPLCHVWYQDPSYSKPDHLLGWLRAGRHVLTCRLPQFPGYMGTYTVSTRLFPLKDRQFGHVLQDIAAFEVVMPSGVLQTFGWSAGLPLPR